MRCTVVVVAALAAAVAGAHLPQRVPHRRHAAVSLQARSDGDVPLVARQSSGLRRSRRCPVNTGTGLTTPSQTPDKPATNVAPTPPTPTENNNNGGGTPAQNGAAPSATRASPSDPYLRSLSQPLNYGRHGAFNNKHTGDMTFYAQGQTACGDVYDDSTYTAAISQLMYDSWAGASGATNRNPVCGPFVTGRYFLSPSDVRVPGSSHATMGGDGEINCTAGEQCHRPLTATVHNPQTGASLRVAVVDRCAGCKFDDIDLAPAAFLRLTRPDLNLAGLPTSQLLLEALKDPQGRITVTWQFDRDQAFGAVRGV